MFGSFLQSLGIILLKDKSDFLDLNYPTVLFEASHVFVRNLGIILSDQNDKGLKEYFWLYYSIVNLTSSFVNDLWPKSWNCYPSILFIVK